MAAKHSRHIALTEPLARHVDTAVAAGDYASASEMVRVALRLLIAREKAETERATATVDVRKLCGTS